jgi:methylmalonyl-CoA mutase C-terminal domain/subunit
MQKRRRILIAKVGLDGHDQGAKIVARSLRDTGFEVIYTGLRWTPEEIVQTAIQEDVDYIGISVLSGAHMTHVPKILSLLKEKGGNDIRLIVGGIVPEKDAIKLKKKGVDEVFFAETPLERIVDYFNK